MKRLIVVCSIVVVASAETGTVLAASARRAHVREFVCQRALDPADRAISITAVMRPLPGTKRMALRFVLLRRRKHAHAFSAVKEGDLGAWIAPDDPTLGQQPRDVWIFKHPVRDLSGPATYRFRVSFRWSGANRHVIGRARRTGPLCDQPELRPDLLVKSISVKAIPGQPGKERYSAVIRNGGLTAAGPFEVWFSYGAVVNKRNVQRLGAHAMLKETFVGPVCTADTAPTVTVDPTHQVDDYNPTNNSLVANCSGHAGR